MSSFSFVCVFLTVLVCNCCADLCFNFGKIKFENDTKLECVNGTWRAKACMADNDEQMADGEVKEQEPFLLQCQKKFDDVMKLVVIGCSMRGRTIAPSQTYEKDDAYYRCNQDVTGKISFDYAGCIVSTKKVPLDDLVQLDGTVYQCVKGDSKPRLEVVGCAHKEHTVHLNEKFVDDFYWYVCESAGDSGATLSVKGCVNDGMPVKEGEVFYKQAIIFECSKSKDGLQAKGVGCLELTANLNMVEHSVGDTWTEVEGKYECKDTGLTVSKVHAL